MRAEGVAGFRFCIIFNYIECVCGWSGRHLVIFDFVIFFVTSVGESGRLVGRRPVGRVE